jgi:hypothetical protein
MTKRNRKSATFYYVRGTSGVDETFDIISRRTGHVVASVPFWEQFKQAEATARLVVTAFNTLEQVGKDIRLEHSIEEFDHLAIVWNTEDVVFVRPDLSHEQAWQVLLQCRRIHEDKLSFQRDLLEAVADELFPEPAAVGGHHAVNR